MKQIKSGTLYIVATPIGNLGDITLRAIEVLKKSELILAEDTRSFGVLKKQFAIEGEVLSYFEQNEGGRIPQVIERLSQGINVALVSEAGTPLISDPGFKLVQECRKLGYDVSPIPGASALIAALSASGLETDQFVFLGFLPVKEGKKKRLLENNLEQNITIIFYESPHRIEKSLRLLSELAPDRPICCAREITKIYEDFNNGTPQNVLNYLVSNNKLKGEFCIIIGKIPKNKEIEDADE